MICHNTYWLAGHYRLQICQCQEVGETLLQSLETPKHQMSKYLAKELHLSAK